MHKLPGLHEIFKYVHLKFTVYGLKHTHNFRQCSHASVGLAEAHPNKSFLCIYQYCQYHTCKQGQLQRIYVANCINFTPNINAVIMHGISISSLNIAGIFCKYAIFESCTADFFNC